MAEHATRRLAEFASRLRYEDLPADVVEKTKQLIRDGLGNQLGASVIAEPARLVLGLLTEFGGAEQATVTGHDDKLPLPFAALANAMLGHGIELDDAHGNALTKSGSLLIPSVMTTGEYRHRSGRDTIVAAVAGYELMVRIGLAVNPSHRNRGYHTTGTVGAIASAGAVARQLDLSSDAMTDALGLGAMQSAGVQAYLDYPCMAKPFSPGKAAFNGTLAALLAERGMTGPREVLESREGFFNAYADALDVGQLFEGLGERYKVSEVAFKPHAACRYAHGPIDAAQWLAKDAGIERADIVRISVNMGELAIRQSGRVEVPNINAAMGSTPFGVALALVRHRNGLADYQEGFADPRVHELARKVVLRQEPEFGYMGRQAVVTVDLLGGNVVEHRVEGPAGEPERPLPADDLEAKFKDLASLALGDERANELAHVLSRLEDVDDLATVADRTRVGAQS